MYRKYILRDCNYAPVSGMQSIIWVHSLHISKHMMSCGWWMPQTFLEIQYCTVMTLLNVWLTHTERTGDKKGAPPMPCKDRTFLCSHSQPFPHHMDPNMAQTQQPSRVHFRGVLSHSWLFKHCVNVFSILPCTPCCPPVDSAMVQPCEWVSLLLWQHISSRGACS